MTDTNSKKQILIIASLFRKNLRRAMAHGDMLFGGLTWVLVDFSNFVSICHPPNPTESADQQFHIIDRQLSFQLEPEMRTLMLIPLIRYSHGS